MEIVGKRITVEGSGWHKTKPEFKVKKGSLNDEAQVWFNFIKSTILPTSHTQTIEKEIMLLLDSIMEARPICVKAEVVAARRRKRNSFQSPPYCCKAKAEKCRNICFRCSI